MRVGTVILVVALGAPSSGVLGQELRDPMAPPAPSTAAVQEPQGSSKTPAAGALQGVISGPQRRLALIDGRIVPLGARVEDQRLIDLGSDSATLQSGGERKTLKLHPEIDKKRSAR